MKNLQLVICGLGLIFLQQSCLYAQSNLTYSKYVPQYVGSPLTEMGTTIQILELRYKENKKRYDDFIISANQLLNPDTKSIIYRSQKYALAKFELALDSYVKSGRWEDAASAIDNSMRNYSSDFESYYNELKNTEIQLHEKQGWEKYNSNDLMGAMQEFNAQIDLDKNNAASFYNRGFVKLQLKDNYGATSDFTTSVELNPKYADAYFLRAQANQNQKNKDKACEDWSKAGELGKNEAYEFIQKFCN